MVKYNEDDNGNYTIYHSEPSPIDGIFVTRPPETRTRRRITDFSEDEMKCLRSLHYADYSTYRNNVSRNPPVPNYLSQENSMIESLGTPWKIFRAVTADQNQLDGIYLIVDVLDECEETSRDNLIRHFQQLIDSRPPDTLPFLKIVVTGRPYAKIESVLQPDFCIRLKSEDNEEKINRDITAYVSDQIKNMEADYDDSLLRDIYQSLTVQTGAVTRTTRPTTRYIKDGNRDIDVGDSCTAADEYR
ncbi:hypothetical protein FPQ18DRAFT_377910 [Pyronema domesticum]|nr:hypothetical protein FPQ18DRAFT_377910 [Pyronema domesticum]